MARHAKILEGDIKTFLLDIFKNEEAGNVLAKSVICHGLFFVLSKVKDDIVVIPVNYIQIKVPC